MSTTLIVVLGILTLFISLIAVNYYRMKNMPATVDHASIKNLNEKNFKNQIKSGIVLVDFWAPWCGPCKMMAPILNDIAETGSNDLTIAKVNVDHNQQLAQKFKIRGIPTTVIFKNGKEVKRFAGVKTKKFILSEVNSI